MTRLRRAALISAAIVAPIVLVFGPLFVYAAWKDGHWRPGADEPLDAVAFSPHAAILVTTRPDER